jgi:hypothetical protein
MAAARRILLLQDNGGSAVYVNQTLLPNGTLQ